MIEVYGTYYSRTVVTPRLTQLAVQVTSINRWPMIIKAPTRERAQRALGVWDVLFTHCCDSKAMQHLPSLQCSLTRE